MNPITDTRIRDCDICLTSHPSMELLQWNCGSCFWCFDCISSGITSAPLKSDWPQIWCGHSIPLPIPLLVILLRSRHHIDEAIYQEWDGKLREWEMIQCPYCFRMTYPKFVEGKVVVCKDCGLRICVECEKSAHPGLCIRTSKEDLQALEQEAAATCPSCKLVAVRTEEKCQHITCPNPCGQNYCSQCSRDWKECNGLCKITTAAEVLDKAAGSSSPNTIKTLLLNLKRDVELEIRLLEQHKKAKKKVAVLKEDCDSFLSIIKQALEDDAITHARFAEIKESVDGFLEPLKMARGADIFEEEFEKQKEEEEVVYSENWRKRGPSPDPLFAAIKKTKTVAVAEEEEEDAEENLDDLELEESMIAALTEGQGEDDHIHNDEEEDIEILVGGDEYGEGDEDEDEDEEYGKGWVDDQIEEDWPNY